MEDSFNDVAALLALAILRLRQRQKSLHNQQYSLDSSSKQSVHASPLKRGETHE